MVKYGKYTSIINKIPYNFNMIENISMKIALEIYMNDEWFDKNYENISDQKYVELENKDYNITVKEYDEGKQPDLSFFVKKPLENKKIDLSNLSNLEQQKIINICYSVLRNKGIYELFVKYYEINKAFPESDSHKQFLSHYAWIMTNKETIMENQIVKKISDSFGILDKKKLLEKLTKSLKKDKLFGCEYFKKYLEIINSNMSSSEQIEIVRDLTTARLYINNIDLSEKNNNNKFFKFGGSKKLENKEKQRKTKKNKEKQRKTKKNKN
jgi:hypothetical protein